MGALNQIVFSSRRGEPGGLESMLEPGGLLGPGRLLEPSGLLEPGRLLEPEGLVEPGRKVNRGPLLWRCPMVRNGMEMYGVVRRCQKEAPEHP